MNLTPASVPLVYQAITDALAPYPGDELTGISCIARGADSIFAQAVLDRGGQLEVVLPSANYREQKVKPDHAPQFDEFMRQWRCGTAKAASTRAVRLRWWSGPGNADRRSRSSGRKAQRGAEDS